MTESVNNRWSHPAVILVATDLSDLDRLMPFALDQAGCTGARLILLHALSTSEAIAVDAVGMPYYDPSTAVDLAVKSLEAYCEAALKKGILCDAVVREGPAAQQILTAVRQFNADRLLLGTRSRGKVSKLLLGSVAEQVLRSVNLPVITVGPEAHLPVGGSEKEAIVLHATTLREASRPSAALACQIATAQCAKLVLLHILPPMDEMQRKGLATGLDSSAMTELRTMAGEIACNCAVPVEAQVLHGNPAIEILAEASQRHASLIVLGSTDRSGFQSLTRDRTVYKVLAHSLCPVLTLRELQVKRSEPALAGAIMHS